jgi:hypothetical protein
MRESATLNRLRAIAAAHAPQSGPVPRDYSYDQGFSEEPARPAGMESLSDPGSRPLLDGLGIGAGWRCLEVGGRRLAGQLDGRSRRRATAAASSPTWAAARLAEVRGEGRTFDFFRSSFESLRHALKGWVDTRLLSREDADTAATGVAEDIRLQTPLMMAGIGCR